MEKAYFVEAISYILERKVEMCCAAYNSIGECVYNKIIRKIPNTYLTRHKKDIIRIFNHTIDRFENEVLSIAIKEETKRLEKYSNKDKQK